MDDNAQDAFDAIAAQLSELAHEASAEQAGEAREIVAAGLATRPFAVEVRRIAPGEVVTVVATNGAPLRGRIVGVGADWLRIGEVADDIGTARARFVRVHDLRIGAIVRITREGIE